ncbi:hypothetical protein COL5a_000575 [Colletotrichum fioriniae]|nr:hypothetical protein COL5a_000575 [Colletotrichum fioriniae]
MKFTLQTALFALTMAIGASAAAVEDPTSAAARRDVLLMERQGANANRPVPNGACCVANTSLKQDVCNVNGGSSLTCIEDSRLDCDPNTLERGRPLCRRRQGA